MGLPTMATAATDTTASALLRLSPRLLPLPTMATVATDTTASALLRLSPRLLPLPTMATAATDTTASALLRLSPLLSTMSQSMDTTGTTASAPLMLSLLPSTTMPTLPTDTTMVKDYSRPWLCRKPPSTILRTASCNIVVGCSQQHCVQICSKAFPTRLTKKPMPSNSCNSFANCNDKISFGFLSPLLSVFDFKVSNYWTNLAHSAIIMSKPQRILVTNSCDIGHKEFTVKHFKYSPRAPIQRANASPEKSSYKIINSFRRQ